jgi:hypothetical protein
MSGRARSRMREGRGRLLLLLTLTAAAACQDHEVVGARAVKTVSVLAASGAYIVVTPKDGAELAALDGVALRIPAGALPGDLVVTIERGGQDIAMGPSGPAGPVVIIGPPGTALSATAQLTLPTYPHEGPEGLVVEALDVGGRRSTVAGAAPAGAGRISASIDSFAVYQAARPRGSAAPDAGGTPARASP